PATCACAPWPCSWWPGSPPPATRAATRTAAPPASPSSWTTRRCAGAPRPRPATSDPDRDPLGASRPAGRPDILEPVSCLGTETIQSLIEGGLADEEGALAVAHVETCPECRALVVGVVRADARPVAAPRLADLVEVAPDHYTLGAEIARGGMGCI